MKPSSSPASEKEGISRAQAWILASRPKTLVAAFIPVAIGTSLAIRADSVQILPAVLCLLFAFLIQIGTNFANDYFDHRKGADTSERLGPQRAVASGLIPPSIMLRATIFVLVLAFMTGLGLLPYGGVPLLIVGIASLLCAIAYTGGPFPLAYLGLGDLFVVLFFGVIAVAFTQYVQTGVFTVQSWVAGLSIGLVINNLLVVNNYRDIEEDTRSGKKTLAVRFGRVFSLWQYGFQTTVAVAGLVILSPKNWLLWCIPALLYCLLQLKCLQALQKSLTAQDYLRCLGTTARYVLLFGILLCVRILS